MDFTAIDFETATRRPDSACQLAAVRVRGGEIVDSESWLIRPRPLRFDSGNIQIHGITPAMVRDEQEFGELWPQILAQLGDDCLIAHNASFDLGVLIACLITHDQVVPDMNYSCTRAIARRTWPQQPRFGLKPLSDWLGIRFRHHDALEDSIACAKIALAAAEDIGATTLEELETKLKLSRGTAGPWGKKGPSTQRRTRAEAKVVPSAIALAATPSVTPGFDLQRLLIRADFIRPLEGRQVVFTGVLTHLQRSDAETLTVRCGGKCQRNVSGKTDLVVTGELDARTRNAGRTMSTKEEAARQLMDGGATMEIITEQEFLKMIVAM